MGTNEFTKENAHEWVELDHVYIVQDEPIGGTGDYFAKAFRTLEEANDDAREQWHYTTERERKQRHIWTFALTVRIWSRASPTRISRSTGKPTAAPDLPMDASTAQR